MVELEPGLDRSRHVGIWCRIRQTPGVVSITDLEAVSQSTLDTILLTVAPVEVVVPAKQEALWTSAVAEWCSGGRKCRCNPWHADRRQIGRGI